MRARVYVTTMPKASGAALLATSFLLSIGTSALLLGYWIMMSVGAGADGLGWLLAAGIYTALVAYLGGGILGVAAVVMAGAAWLRSRSRRAVMAVGLAVLTLVFWNWLRMGGPTPRGPLG
jgi:hypothetical protein